MQPIEDRAAVDRTTLPTIISAARQLARLVSRRSAFSSYITARS